MKQIYFLFLLILVVAACKNKSSTDHSVENTLILNMLDYNITPVSPTDRSSLAFSDQGAWFAYGLPDKLEYYGGFSGPFLMTQENGVWVSPSLSQLKLIETGTGKTIDWNNFNHTSSSYNSHLEQVFESEKLKIKQTLFFISPHTALITNKITNKSNKTFNLQAEWHGITFLEGLQLNVSKKNITIISDRSDAIGNIHTPGEIIQGIYANDTSYSIEIQAFHLEPGAARELLLTQSFIFPEYDWAKEQLQIDELPEVHQQLLQSRIREKESQLEELNNHLDTSWNNPIYKDLLSKTVLTLQNNWRVPAGELKHSGLFPSYHYLWFHAFWAWDSWKHAAALAYFNTELAKEQIKAMYDFMDEDGFIADCVFRDTIVEKHNFRNTKPPLSAWAVWEIYQKDNDLNFLKELYPKIRKQHHWWYAYRDYDRDGICEYGSTDGSLVAAKWESGMDNAVRFDDCQILKNSGSAYSLNQESVDLNAYLYAEKIFLIEMARILQKVDDISELKKEAEALKINIQKQFFDAGSGWFYDTSIDGETFIDAMGCEGWIPLWARIATTHQAEAVKTNMMNPLFFNGKVPFQTLSASHPKFKPDGGYWRGPVWLDQSYFGVIGLHNYGYIQEAYGATYKLFHNADGVLGKGKSIRENYNPVTGEGLESENFSWSAAHYLLLLINENHEN